MTLKKSEGELTEITIYFIKKDRLQKNLLSMKIFSIM